MLNTMLNLPGVNCSLRDKTRADYVHATPVHTSQHKLPKSNWGCRIFSDVAM
jgi:hypothetical protein